MTTRFPAGPCEPHVNIPAETIRERLQCVLLRRVLPWLVRVEMSPSTNAELRDLIRQIEVMTNSTPKTKGEAWN